MNEPLNTMPALNTNATRTSGMVIAAIVAVSAGASLFLCWLVYYHVPTDTAGTRLLFLPALNALLNALSATALVAGFRYVRSGRIGPHRAAMFTAFVFSTVFLVTYIVNHALHGDMHFHGQGPIRPAYFALLISHITLSVIALPMILITFFFSLSGRFPAHRRLARFTFPIWLYVSVTGVIVYSLLAAYR
jgi:putative membrane protein